MKITAVGDILPQKRVLTDYDGFDAVQSFLAQGDARFCNLETTFNRAGECFASQFSGGTYIRSDPETLGDVQKFGFNLTTANNNHAFDFSYEGFAQTLQTLQNSGLVYAGIGRNLHEASAPAYLETKNGRVALVSVNTSFEPCMMAGVQSRRTPGRPGINGLRLSREVVVPKDAFNVIREISQKSGINADEEYDRMEGYSLDLPEGVCEIGEQRFVCKDRYDVNITVNASDKKRMENAIREASERADYVILSIHMHQTVPGGKEKNPPYIEELAHFAIDAGADAVIGHGPHLLRPIEVYHDRPIFYSLGDFLMQLYDVPYAPEEFYSKYGLNSDASVAELLKTRSNNYTRGLMEQDVALETVIPLLETDGKKLKSLKLLPIRISRHEGKQLEGLPKVAKDPSFIDRLAEMSLPYGTKIQMGKDGIAVCKW